MRLPLAAVEAARGQQRANRHQRYPKGQIEARAGRALGFNGICLEDKDIHQPNATARPIPPSMKHTNIGRGRRFPINSRSTTSSFGFSAARQASPINDAVILCLACLVTMSDI